MLRPWRGLLVAVLADVNDSQLREQANVRCRKGLGHGDDGDLTRVAPGRAAGEVDACPYRSEIRLQLGSPCVDAHASSHMYPAARPVSRSRRCEK
jgi:hypothetical protein